MAKQEIASIVRAIIIVWELNSGIVGVGVDVAVGCVSWFWFGLVEESAVAKGVD